MPRGRHCRIFAAFGARCGRLSRYTADGTCLLLRAAGLGRRHAAGEESMGAETQRQSAARLRMPDALKLSATVIIAHMPQPPISLLMIKSY